MKHNLIKNVLFLLLLVSIQVTAQSTSFAASGFKASFPAAPEVAKEAIDSKIGKIQITRYTYSDADCGCMIVVSHNLYPKEMFDKLGKVGQKGVIDGAKKGIIKNIEAEMEAKFIKEDEHDFVYQQKYDATTLSGLIAEIDLTATLIIKDNSLYSYIIIGDMTSGVASEFATSFTLTEN